MFYTLGSTHYTALHYIILYTLHTKYPSLYYTHIMIDEDLRRLKQLINKDVIKSNNQAALEEK